MRRYQRTWEVGTKIEGKARAQNRRKRCIEEGTRTDKERERQAEEVEQKGRISAEIRDDRKKHEKAK